MDTNYHERYANLSDDELLHIAGDRRDLLQEATVALDAEMARRGLTHKQAQAKKRDDLRLDIKEARSHYRKRNKSKYFVGKMNLGAYFLGLVGLVLLIVLVLGPYKVPEEWSFPIFVMYIGVLIACLAVQPWVRRTLSFWFSLAVSCVFQFFVAHWLALYHPSHSRSGTKGAGFLSILAGYLSGVALFLLLQRLRPKQETNFID